MKWKTAEPVAPEIAQTLAGTYPAILQLLNNRGIRTKEEADVFLSPDWQRDTFDCSMFSNMLRAVSRVFDAMTRGEMITVHGDYDADGVCGSAVLLSTLKDIATRLGLAAAKFSAFIPHREKDGYGLSVKTVEHLREHEQTYLIITVDCGISNNEAIAHARVLGIETIVCDHHAMPPELPREAILIHPQVPGETYPNKKLCGTGVAFKLACGLIQEARARGARIPDGHEKWLLDLVAIATVTDMVSLLGENRALETFGLVVLNKTQRTGIRALCEVMGSRLGELDTHSIGFHLGPRINAAGRMNHANEALYLLLETDVEKAREMARRLHATNIDRQRVSNEMYMQAKAMLGDAADDVLLVACQKGWSAGLVGLVAGKLVHDYGRPVIIAGEDEQGKFMGSGRSIEGVDIVQALHAAGEYLDRFGGHPQACGFSTTGRERFAVAMEAMRGNVVQQLHGKKPEPMLAIEAELALEDITWDLWKELARMAPFGMENPKPIFCSRHVVVRAVDSVGADGKHLRLTVASQTGKMCKMIGFGFGAWAAKLRLGDRLDVAYEITENHWNGTRELQLRIVDLQSPPSLHSPPSLSS